MALLDISLVTRALIRLLREHIRISPAWSPQPAPTVSPLPPDRLPEGALGVYLFHVMEEAHAKSLPPLSPSAPQIRYTPMGLQLHYQIFSEASADTDDKMFSSQLLLGCAVKALHDYPNLTDETVVNGVNIFQEVGLDGQDNRIRISLTPVASQDAARYWEVGQDPLRLAMYYQASAVLLEPEAIPSRSGRVLRYGVYSFVSGAPYLQSSENRLSVQVPGSDPQEIRLQPANVPVGGAVDFHGLNLTGEETVLLLEASDWDQPLEADSAWITQARDNRITATVQETLGAESILPGIYTLRVRVSRTRAVPEGGEKTFRTLSNAMPFTIAPRIDTVGAPDGAGVVDVTGFIFQHADLDPEDVQVFLGSERAAAGDFNALNPLEFGVFDPNTLRVRLPAGFPAGQSVPLRILVNGAESPPQWIST